MTLTEEQLKEIAEQLDMSFKCFVHIQTNELVFLPDFDNNPDFETEFWEDDINKIKEHIDEYIVIEKPHSSEYFQIMEEFTERLPDRSRLKYRLIDALEGKKPFRVFKNAIDNAGDYRQEWFTFKSLKLKELVKNKIDLLMDIDED